MIASRLISILLLLAAALPASAQNTIFSKLEDNPSIERTYVSSSAIRHSARYLDSSVSPQQVGALSYIEVVESSDANGRELIKKELNKFLKANPDLELTLSDSSKGSKSRIYVRYTPDGKKHNLTIIYSETNRNISVTVICGEHSVSMSHFPVFSLSSSDSIFQFIGS